jgi:hypothetical protein
LRCNTTDEKGVRTTLNPAGEPSATPALVWSHFQKGCSLRMLCPQKFEVRLFSHLLCLLFVSFLRFSRFTNLASIIFAYRIRHTMTARLSSLSIIIALTFIIIRHIITAAFVRDARVAR